MDSEKIFVVVFEVGINFFDMVYVYGVDGISECLIGCVFWCCFEEVVIVSKVGLKWNEKVEWVYSVLVELICE